MRNLPSANLKHLKNFLLALMFFVLSEKFYLVDNLLRVRVPSSDF